MIDVSNGHERAERTHQKKPNPSFIAKLQTTPTDALFSASICIRGFARPNE